ncbi:MAG: ATP-binding cassette domain-containing protein [Burkholderiaceae bacterium]|nr:ATP-binding cassette domain-containing protein [Burkholderiaceae bacterium]
MKDFTQPEVLRWVLMRLAGLQGVGLDALRLTAAIQSQSTAPLRLSVLGLICRALELPAPRPMMQPDRAVLPLVCMHPQYGLGVIVDQRAQNDHWVVAFPSGERDIPAADLSGAGKVAQVRLRASGMRKTGFRQAVSRALRLYRGALVEASLASVFIGLLALMTSLFSMQVYDRVIPTRGEHTLVVLGVGVMLTIMIELVMKLARSRLMDEVAAGLDARLSRHIFQRLLSVRLDQMPGSVGSLAAQIRGYEQVRSYYTASTLFALVDFPIALLFIVVVGMMASPMVALVPLVACVVAIALGIWQRKHIRRLATEGAQGSNLKTGLLVEAVEGAETIKAGSGGWKFLSRWIYVNEQAIGNDLRLRGATENLAYTAATLQQLSYVAIVAVGAWAVIAGGMTMGALIACSILSGRIMSPILVLPSLLVQHAHAQAAMDGLEKLYDLQSDNEGVERSLAPMHMDGAFTLTDVRFAYPGGPVAFAAPHLEIKAGERVGVLGPIGAGKSTLLRLLAGLYRPLEGRVFVDGLDMAHINRQSVSQEIGYLQQDHRLFQGTLRENLLIGMPDPGDDRIRLVIQRSGLIKLVSSHPLGLELPILEGGRGLSGGQRQLVAFSRLLLSATPILLLDEPTASMDEEQEHQCLAVLKDEIHGKRKTVVIVTHKASVLPLVDRLIVMMGNRIVLDGPRDVVLSRLKQQQVRQAEEPHKVVVASLVPSTAPTSSVINGEGFRVANSLP